VAVDGVIALHLHDQRGIAEPDAVAGRRAVHLGVGPARDPAHESTSSGPITRPRQPYTLRVPPYPTSATVRVCPGSKRAAVPAAPVPRPASWPPRAPSRSSPAPAAAPGAMAVRSARRAGS